MIIRTLTFSLVFLASLTVCAQNSEFEEFLTKADIATVQYQNTFKNLVAEELRIYDYYRKDGSLEDSRKIKSTFVVYQSPRNRLVAEYRNVLEFNGKNVARDDEDVVKLFEKLAKSDTSEEEVARLRKEGNRYDGRSHSYGMTLIQAFVLNSHYRQFFEFVFVGREQIDGHETVVVAYKQIAPTSTIKASPTDEERKKEPKGINFDIELPSSFQPTNPRLQGRLWLDAKTASLWRNEFTVSIHPAVLSKPIVSSEFRFDYQASDFGALLPKRFTMTAYRFSGKTEKEMVRTRSSIKIFEYSKFTKPDSEIKETKISN